jgi:hypothetical protein
MGQCMSVGPRGSFRERLCYEPGHIVSERAGIPEWGKSMSGNWTAKTVEGRAG